MITETDAEMQSWKEAKTTSEYNRQTEKDEGGSNQEQEMHKYLPT